MGIPGLGGSLVPNKFMYKRQGPWPQPSPSHPTTCADEVLNIPTDEALYFDLYIGRRYLQAMSDYPPCAARYVLGTPSTWRPQTPEFETIMYTTLYTRFLTTLSDTDKSRLTAASIPYTSQTMKYDFTAMNLLQPLPGTYCAATVVIVDTSQPVWKTVCIFLSPVSATIGPIQPPPANMTVIKPTDPAWTLAMVFAMQGAAYHVLFVVHPALHFPTDSVNAITKTAVPIAHPLFQLLYPHSTYQLALDNGVLESAASVVNDEAHGTRFDPLTAEAYNLKRLFGAGFSGLGADGYDPNAYPAYDYSNPVMGFASSAYGNPVAYGTWLANYFGPFMSFCKAVASVLVTNPLSNPYAKYVTRWARYVNVHVPGFPNETQILDRDTLAKTLAIYMWNNSVAHGGDHYSFTYHISVVEKCLRIRVPAPTSASEPDPGAPIFTPDDLARAALCQWMFFHPWAVNPTLSQTQYNFADQALFDASTAFQSSLKQVDRTWDGTFLPLIAPQNPPPPKPPIFPPDPPYPAVPPPTYTLGIPFQAVPSDAVTIPQSIQY